MSAWSRFRTAATRGGCGDLPLGDDLPLGAADCERIRDGIVAQPANTLSAAALVASGLWITRRRRPHRHARMVGTVVAAAGLGSVAYHGPGGRTAGWAHDATIAAMLGVVCLEDVREVRPDLADVATLVYAGATVGVGLLLAARPDAMLVITALLAGAALAAETSARRTARGGRRRAHRTADAVMAAAFAAYLAGRTGARTCRPDSWLQPHGMWHALCGVAMAAWSKAALQGS